MSVLQMTLVFRHSRAKGNTRLVLLALADVASDDGEVSAYARGRKILATKANCDENTVRRAIDSLVELGELEVVRQGGGRTSSDYRIHVDPPPIEGLQIAPPGGTDHAPTGDETRPLGVQDAPPVSPSSSVDGPSSSEPALFDAGDPEPKRKPSRRITAGWRPSIAVRQWCASEHPETDVDRTVATFVDYWLGRGVARADWDATFRNWVRRNAESTTGAPAGNSGRAGRGAIREDLVDRDRDAVAGEVRIS